MGRYGRNHSHHPPAASAQRAVTAVICLGLLLCLGSSPALAQDDARGGAARPLELKQALDVTISTAVGVELLKRTFQAPRPPDSGMSGYAFPSGEAALAFGLAEVAVEYHPRQKWLWYCLAAAVGWWRVSSDAHSWPDVIAGAAVGACLGDITVDHGGLVLKRWEW